MPKAQDEACWGPDTDHVALAGGQQEQDCMDRDVGPHGGQKAVEMQTTEG